MILDLDPRCGFLTLDQIRITANLFWVVFHSGKRRIHVLDGVRFAEGRI